MSDLSPSFFVRIQGKQSGPYSGDQLRAMAARGTLGVEDEVQRVGGTAWHKAKTVKGLFPALPPPLPSQSQAKPPPVPSQYVGQDSVQVPKDPSKAFISTKGASMDSRLKEQLRTALMAIVAITCLVVCVGTTVVVTDIKCRRAIERHKEDVAVRNRWQEYQQMVERAFGSQRANEMLVSHAATEVFLGEVSRKFSITP